MVIPRFIEQAKANEDITVFGDGMQTRDFTYIDDTIEACIKLMEVSKGCEIYNIANESEGCIKDLAHAIKKITGSNSAIVYLEAPKKDMIMKWSVELVVQKIV
ncbi:MAG: NAD-dependent epimerase/dehydratase family protein [Crocinitomicaceae bacterium]|nr:NAD-dependent epimerase/dehydratase family protein [Crocinitomicaceae bacterium]